MSARPPSGTWEDRPPAGLRVRRANLSTDLPSLPNCLSKFGRKPSSRWLKSRLSRHGWRERSPRPVPGCCTIVIRTLQFRHIFQCVFSRSNCLFSCFPLFVFKHRPSFHPSRKTAALFQISSFFGIFFWSMSAQFPPITAHVFGCIFPAVITPPARENFAFLIQNFVTNLRARAR